LDKNLSGYKKCSETRDSLGRLTTPYPEKRSQARGVRFPPDMDAWLVEQKKKRNCSFNDLMIEAVELLMKKKNANKNRGEIPFPKSQKKQRTRRKEHQQQAITKETLENQPAKTETIGTSSELL